MRALLQRVSEASVSYASERATVNYDPAQVGPTQMIDKLGEIGYGAAIAQIDLPISGMTCNNCAATITRSLKRIDGVIVNDSEVKSLTGKSNLIQAGRAALELGPKLASGVGGVDVPASAHEEVREALGGLGYGDREVDIAMSRLFGPLPDAFYQGYEAVAPLPADHSERQGLYQLYYLIHHARVFGGHYVEDCRQQLKRLLACEEGVWKG